MPDRIEIDRGIDDICQRIHAIIDCRYLPGLDEAEMPLGQRETILAQDRSEKAYIYPVERRRHQREMPSACHAIEDHAYDIDAVAISSATQRHSGSRLGLPGDVEHQHHRPAKKCSQISGRASPALSPRRGAIE